MSRTVFAVLASELLTVRLICQRPGCGAVTELTVDRMAAVMAQPACPVCAAPFIDTTGAVGANPLTQLARALHAIQGQQVVGVEFVIPEQQP